MNYNVKPIVYHDQFVEWLHATFPDWTEDDIDDVLEFLLDYSNYVEIHFVGNDEDLSTCDEDEFEIFVNVNRVYAELRNLFSDSDYTSMLVCCDW